MSVDTDGFVTVAARAAEMGVTTVFIEFTEYSFSFKDNINLEQKSRRY